MEKEELLSKIDETKKQLESLKTKLCNLESERDYGQYYGKVMFTNNLKAFGIIDRIRPSEDDKDTVNIHFSVFYKQETNSLYVCRIYDADQDFDKKDLLKGIVVMAISDKTYQSMLEEWHEIANKD